MHKPRLLRSFSKGISVFVMSGEKAPAEPKLSLKTTSFFPRARLKDVVSPMYAISQRRKGGLQAVCWLRREGKRKTHKGHKILQSLMFVGLSLEMN